MKQLDTPGQGWAADLRATLKSLLARKLRLVLSGLAVVLGVMFVSGAFVLTDTLGRSFDGGLRRGHLRDHRRKTSRRKPKVALGEAEGEQAAPRLPATTVERAGAGAGGDRRLWWAWSPPTAPA